MSSHANRRMRATAAIAAPVPLPSPQLAAAVPLMNVIGAPTTSVRPLIHQISMKKEDENMDTKSTVLADGKKEMQNKEQAVAEQKQGQYYQSSVVEYSSSGSYGEDGEPEVCRTVRRYKDSNGREKFVEERSLGKKKHKYEWDNKEILDRPGAVKPKVETNFGDDDKDYTAERFEEDWKKRQQQSRGGGFSFGANPFRKVDDNALDKGGETIKEEGDKTKVSRTEDGEQQAAVAAGAEENTPSAEVTFENEYIEGNPNQVTTAAETEEEEKQQEEQQEEQGEEEANDNTASAENSTAKQQAEKKQRAMEIFNRCAKSVCHITPLMEDKDFFGPFFESFFQGRGTGNGFLWDEEHIVTNFQVLQRNHRALVTMSDGQTTREARVVGFEPDMNVVVLKLVEQKTPSGEKEEEKEEPKFCPLQLGSSEGLKVGQRVLAIGSGRSFFGPDQLTLTGGVVSGLGRKLQGLLKGGRSLGGLVQTDFSGISHPGIYSGGLLLDPEGHLVGLNTKVIATSNHPLRRGATGFAIPVEAVARVVREILTHGHTIRPWLGVRVVPESALLSRRRSSHSLLGRFFDLELADDEQEASSARGVLVVGVEEKSPAAEANLRPMTRTRHGSVRIGDKILALEGKEVRTPEELVEAVEEHQVGDKVQLLVLRQDQDEPEDLSVELGTRPNRSSLRMTPEEKKNVKAAAPQSNL